MEKISLNDVEILLLEDNDEKPSLKSVSFPPSTALLRPSDKYSKTF